MTNQEQYELMCEKAKKYDRLAEQYDRLVDNIDRIIFEIKQSYSKPIDDYAKGRNYGLHIAIDIINYQIGTKLKKGQRNYD